MISPKKIAVILMSIFISTVLMKPLHFTFTDHSHSCSGTSQCTSEQSLSDQHHDCSFCLFSFYNFTPQKLCNIWQPISVNITKLLFSDKIAPLLQPILSVSTRGPPKQATHLS